MKSFTKFLASIAKIGCIGFGGGSALIPVIENELIGQDKLDTKENYDKDILVANLTPGALPVELAGSIGARNFGIPGMLLGAAVMAFPGAVVTVILLTFLSSLRESVGILMDVLTIAVSIFIIYLIIHYIIKVCNKCKGFSPIFYKRSIFVMVGVFVLTCGKNVYKLLGISGTPVVYFSTFTVLVAAFAVIICINIYRGFVKKKKGKKMTDAKAPTAVETKALIGNICKKSAVWIVFVVLLSLPAVLYSVFTSAGANVMATLNYMGRGCLSALMSFGGGDAYLAVADGLFVEPDIVSSETFYGDIVSVANILPGSILCKALTAIGYTYGTALTGSALGGVCFALAGFAISVAMSCMVFGIVYELYNSLSDFQTMHTITHYIGPIISGLLITVILALLMQCKSAGVEIVSAIVK